MAKKLAAQTLAPDFSLKDTQGNRITLSAYRGRQPVVLVLTRGFM